MIASESSRAFDSLALSHGNSLLAKTTSLKSDCGKNVKNKWKSCQKDIAFFGRTRTNTNQGRR